MSGLIPKGKNAAERAANMKKITGGLQDDQRVLFGDQEDTDTISEHPKGGSSKS